MDRLTAKDRACLDLICRHDLSYAEAGYRLHLSPETIKNRLHAIYLKLGVGSRAGACFRWGQVSIDPSPVEAGRAHEV